MSGLRNCAAKRETSVRRVESAPKTRLDNVAHTFNDRLGSGGVELSGTSPTSRLKRAPTSCAQGGLLWRLSREKN